MRYNTATLTLAIATTAAFAAGFVASPLVRYAIADARAETAPLTPAMVDLMGMKLRRHSDHAEPGDEFQAAGQHRQRDRRHPVRNVAKHAHPKTDEIQYIIEGSGAMWLGGERKEFKPGTLIIIPRARRTAEHW